MKKEIFDIIVLGGGPAGMMAAGRAGELGSRVLLIEKNDRLGKKLSITGGRRCNITNAERNNHLFLDNFPESKQFLFSPFSQFNVDSTFEFFERRGLPLVVEDRNRAFPKSEKAEDVCEVLRKYVSESGNVKVKLNTAFISFVIKDGLLTGVKTSSGTFYASRIIIATGGLAAPETGSTGEGLSALAFIGHSVKEPDPDMAPLRTSSKWVHSLLGTTVEDMELRFIQNEKTKLKKRGRLLFTHFGISGPLVINSAHEVKKLLKKGTVIASVDLFPDYDLGSMDSLLLDLFEQHKNKQLKTALKELLQKKLSEVILELPKVPNGDTPVHSITKEQRKILVRTLKDLRFPINGTMGFEWSIVADGGVAPKEVDFKSMTSRLFSNLYLIGDTLNISRPSGGFSLQLCWTTGWIAGTHAAQN
ncbi:MAG: NAD(P)/FAD-dependent oxidoreductase [Candidatus Uhrbacteria bacterium]|nr:NAD(P)/FAD-dependent oxidoreductase [Candidatus Uhrbacteria bacterium]